MSHFWRSAGEPVGDETTTVFGGVALPPSGSSAGFGCATVVFGATAGLAAPDALAGFAATDGATAGLTAAPDGATAGFVAAPDGASAGFVAAAGDATAGFVAAPGGAAAGFAALAGPLAGLAGASAGTCADATPALRLKANTSDARRGTSEK